MDTLEAIFTRRSIKVVRPDPIPRELVERLLAAAVQAPNHHRVRPWRFIVLEGDARHRLGDVMADILQAKFPDLDPAALDKERCKPLRAPLLIAVAADLPDDPRVIELENICAAAAATQNLLLAAQDLGLGAMWRTGSTVSEPRVKEFLGLMPGQPLIAMVYIGFPEPIEQTPLNRPSFHDRTVWME
jgi:nitroreductase